MSVCGIHSGPARGFRLGLGAATAVVVDESGIKRPASRPAGKLVTNTAGHAVARMNPRGPILQSFGMDKKEAARNRDVMQVFLCTQKMRKASQSPSFWITFVARVIWHRQINGRRLTGTNSPFVVVVYFRQIPVPVDWAREQSWKRGPFIFRSGCHELPRKPSRQYSNIPFEQQPI